ncbi:MAG TPA: phage head closure protein [Methanocella sp.]|jgi:SPP1 family predicted phage head-tail adaptor
MIEPGTLNRKVTIQYNSGATDVLGGVSKNWVTLATINASVETLDSKVVTYATQRGSLTTVKVGIRYRPAWALYNSTCKGKHLRVIYDGRTFGVTGVNDAGENHEIVYLTCEELP